MLHCASAIVDLGNTSRASFIATLAMVMSISFCHATSADSGSITSTTMEKSSRKRSYMHTGSLIPSFWMRANMCTTSRGLASYICLKVSSERKEISWSSFVYLLEGIIRKERDEYFDEENGEEITGEELSNIV